VSPDTDSVELLSPSQAGLSGRLISEERLVHLSYVRHLDNQADFYKRVFSLVETDRGVSGAGNPIVFLTEGSTKHQRVLTADLPADTTNPPTRKLT
jgi:hypothetical protein